MVCLPIEVRHQDTSIDLSTMRRKRINHQVDVFCEMFSGWRLSNDLETLIELKRGHLYLDFLNKSIKLNGELWDKEFHMLYEIAAWFDKDINDFKIDKYLIKEASLSVDFDVSVKERKSKSRTIRDIELNLQTKSKIETDEVEYSAEKKYP